MPRRSVRPNPVVGTVRSVDFKGHSYTMEVVEIEGEMLYKVNDITYRSPSGAAKSITGYEVNGWRLWHLDT